MSATDDALTQVNNALGDLQTAVTDLSSEVAVPSLSDQVLEAILPILTAAGYTAPVVSTEPTTIPVTDGSESTDTTS